MELTTVERPGNATELLSHYYDLPEADRTSEDEVMIDLLESLEDDEQVIDIRRTISAGGQDENGRPRLALGRADWQTCYLYQYGHRTRFQPAYWLHHNAQAYSYQGLFEQPAEWSSRRMAAIVPPIPPAFRPRRWKLRRYLILWEAQWAEAPLPPGDPALLRPIGHGTLAAGRLAVVEHVWDPTPLELMVLGMR